MYIIIIIIITGREWISLPAAAIKIDRSGCITVCSRGSDLADLDGIRTIMYRVQLTLAATV